MKALAIAALLSSGAVEARFAPVLGAPYRLVRTQSHYNNRDHERRFESERRVVFVRDASGYIARITLVGTRDSRGDSDYAMLAAAMGDRPIEVELDRGGHILRVRDLDAIWARMRDAIGAAATSDSVRLTLWRVHDAATTAQRVQVVAGALSIVLAPDEAQRRAGTRAVILPPVGVVQPALPLQATEMVRSNGVSLEITVTGSSGAGGTTLSLARRRTIDRRSGMVTEQQDDQTVGSSIGGEGHLTRDVTVITFAPPVS